jgi:hypothetical protein
MWLIWVLIAWCVAACIVGVAFSHIVWPNDEDDDA